MAVAFVALLAALSGTAIALPGTNSVDSGDIKNNVVRSKDVRNNNLRGTDVRNSSLSGADVRNDSLTGLDINESTLGQVPSANSANSANTANSATNATTAQTLQGRTPADFASSAQFRTFFEYIEAGQTRTLATNGPLTLQAECTSGGGNDEIDIQVVSSVAGAQSAGSGPLTAGVPASVLTLTTTTGTAEYANDIDEDSQIAGDGSYFGIDGETVGLGLNLYGHRCVTAGVITALNRAP